jgi:hypothetical protein
MGMSTTLFDFDFASMAPLVLWLKWNLTLNHAKDFAHVIRAFIPFAPTLAFLKMINAFLAFHPLDIDSLYSNSLLDFQLNLELELFMDSFRLAFLCMFQLLVGGPSSMVFKHL